MARYIDADKLKDKIRPYYDKVLHQNISDGEKLAKHDMISDVMFEINEQPTADVKEVVRGKWVRSVYADDFHKCSECDSVWSKKFNFCPSCGADMGGGVDGTENI